MATLHDDGFVSAERLGTMLDFVGTPAALAARRSLATFAAEGRLLIEGPSDAIRPTITGLRNLARRRMIPLRIHVTPRT